MTDIFKIWRYFTGERLQASNEDLALAVNAATADTRNENDDDED